MTSRQARRERREAERKARKLARKAEKSEMLNASLQVNACADEHFDEKLCVAEPEERKAEQAQALDTAARRYVIAKKSNQSFDPPANGFEFSTAEIERYLDGLSPARIASRGHSVGSATSPKDLLTDSCLAKSQVEAA